MRRTLLAVAAAAAFLAMASPAQRAEAMPLAAPAQLGQADGAVVQKAAIVCGYYGCRRVWPGYYGRPYWGPRPYWGWRRPYWGWRRPYWGWRRW